MSFADALLDHAALAGNFNPKRYARGVDLSDPAVEAAFAMLARHCDEGADGTGSGDGNAAGWRLRPHMRARILARWDDPAAMARRRFRRWRPLAGDHFARAMQILLARGTISHKAVAGLAAKEVIQAASFLAPLLPPGDAARLRGLERALFDRMVTAFRDAKARDTLPGVLVGRDREMAALDAFVTDRAISGPITALGQGQSPRSLALVAETGIGKSAFLTQFLKTRSGADYWVVVLDFERLALRLGDPGAWSAEISRQIGQQAPKPFAARLSEARRAGAHGSTRDGQKDGAATTGLSAALAAVFADLPPRGMVLVLENFQEIIRLDPDTQFKETPDATVAGAVMGWCRALATHLPDLCTIAASHRLPPLSDPAHWFGARLDLAELEVDGAAALLEIFAKNSTALPKGMIDRLAETVGGHPLHLKMIERFLRDNPARASDTFLHDLGRAVAMAFSNEMKTHAVLSVCLRNIDWPEIPGGPDGEMCSAILNTGLPLRMLDADLLRQVVAPVLGLTLTRRSAAALIDAFAHQAWLIKSISDAPVKLIYRSDIRRSVLRERLNVAANQARDLVTLLDLASRVFAERDAATELGYIAALRGDPTPFVDNRALASAVYGLALPDLAMFSPAIRGTLMVLADENAVPGDEEISALPARLRDRAALGAGLRRGPGRQMKYGFSGR